MAGRSSATSAAISASPALIPLGHHIGKPPIPLIRPATVIGSRSTARIHLTSSTVSKAHALVIRDGPVTYIRDLASRNKIYINGEEIRDEDLEDGDLIKIGSFTFKFRSAEQPGDSLSESQRLPPGQLQVSGADYPVPIDQRVLLVGRRSSSDVHLLEESVSIAHAVIFEMSGQRHIRDLGSRTGTFVNGVQVHQHQLNPGDSIRIGETTLNYVPTPAFVDSQQGIELSGSATGGELEIIDDTATTATESEPAYGATHDQIDFSPSAPHVEARSEDAEAIADDALGLAIDHPTVEEKTPRRTAIPSARSTPPASADNAVAAPPLSEAGESLSPPEDASESDTRSEDAASEVAGPIAQRLPASEEDADLSPRRGWRATHPEQELHKQELQPKRPEAPQPPQEQDESVLRFSPPENAERDDQFVDASDDSATAVAEPEFTAGSFVDESSRDDNKAGASLLDLTHEEDDAPSSQQRIDIDLSPEAERHAPARYPRQEKAPQLDLSALGEGAATEETLEPVDESGPAQTIEPISPAAPSMRFDQDQFPREPQIPAPAEEPQVERVVPSRTRKKPRETVGDKQIVPAKKSRSRRVPPPEAPVESAPPADEVVDSTEPTLDSALDVPIEADAPESPVIADEPVSEEPLTDTAVSRAIEDFGGEAGEIVETPPAVEEPAATTAQPPYQWGANQENFLGGTPVALPLPSPQEIEAEHQPQDLEFSAPEAPAEVPQTHGANFEEVNALIDEILSPDAAPQPLPSADDLLGAGQSGNTEVVEELDETSLEDEGHDLLQSASGDDTEIAPAVTEPVGDSGVSIPLPPPIPLTPPPSFAPAQSRPVVPIPPPPARGNRRERRRRDAETLEPVGMDGLREDERIPPYSGALPATVGRVTSGFDGLAMPPVREADVFFQMSPPSPTATAEDDPFAGMTAQSAGPALTPMDLVQPDEPPARTRRQPVSGRTHVPRDLFFGGAAPAPTNGGAMPSLAMPDVSSDAPSARRRSSARPTIPTLSPVPIPQDEPQERTTGANRWPAVVLGDEDVDAVAAARRRRTRYVTGVLVSWIALWLGVSAAIFYLFPVVSVTEAPVKFENFDRLTNVERKQLRDEQQALLATEMTRTTARRLLSQHDAEISPGFLDDSEKYLAAASLSTWPESRKGTMLLHYRGKADPADRGRMLAMAQALIQSNESRIRDARNAKRNYQELQDSITRNEQEQKRLADEIVKLRTAGESAPDAKAINKIRDDRDRLDKAWSDALAAVKVCEAELAQLKASDTSAAGNQQPNHAGGADAGAGAGDDQVGQLEAQLKELTGKITAAQSSKAQQAEAAKKVLDSALADFEQQVAATRELMKDSPELATYVAAAQRLQETTRSLIDDLIRRQEHQYTRLNDLKTQLTEKMEQRRLEQYGADPQLKELNERLETEKRLFNAAKASGQKKESDERQAAIDLLNSMIRSRQELIPKDALKDYADTIAQLQQIIDVTQKNVEEDRKRTDSLLADLQKDFTSTKSVTKLPEAQKSTAAELEKKIADINSAREQYNKAISATANDDDESMKQMRTQAAALQGSIDTRRKELADANERNLNQQQEKSRQDLIAQKETELKDLKETASNAQLARINREKDLREAESLARDARDTLDRLQSLQDKKQRVDILIQQARQDEQNRKEAADRAIQPLSVTEDQVQITKDPDQRPIYWGASTGVIFLLFAGLLLFTLHATSPELVVRQMATRAARDRAEQTQPQPSASESRSKNGNGQANSGHDTDDQQPAVV